MARLADPAVRRRWEERIRSFERTGLSVVSFCEKEGVSTANSPVASLSHLQTKSGAKLTQPCWRVVSRCCQLWCR
jgi:hypothetical protein